MFGTGTGEDNLQQTPGERIVHFDALEVTRYLSDYCGGVIETEQWIVRGTIKLVDIE